jgi:photosystem II stability/assembly factor-like uncharacterized protein
MRARGLWIAGLACLVLAGGVTRAAEDGAEDGKEEGRLSAETFAGLELRGIGPGLMSGRIADIAISPGDRNTWYVGVGSGGVWKTTNAGTSWESIFDGQGSYSIGEITVDPNDSATIWVGTGENVGGRHVGFGDGVYVSRNGGASWENSGLKESEHIGSIVVDPRDSSVLFVAAQGPLWSKGGERGVYKSTDGGGSWTQVLGAGEYTGANEVVIDPRDPDVLYAALHQRFRTVAALINGGPESGIWKSTDGGESWREVTEGLPTEDMGKIGLAISPFDSDIVYATIELAHRKGGFYRSTDGGESWEKRNEYLSGGTGPHYYQELFASPHQLDRVYQMDAPLHKTEDGGTTFVQMEEEFKHGDNHAMAFDPDDPDYLLVGSDGGLYESFDLGATWRFVANLPVTQFYKVAVDYDEPFYHLIGGTQDNNTQYGPSRTDNVHGIRNSDWMITLFGDGHQPAIDYSNPNIIYSEWQGGNPVRFDRATGEMVYIRPQPEPDEEPERFNWDSPILISPHDPARIYYASQRLWRSDDRGDSWTPISGDLTRDLDRIVQPMMDDRIWSPDAVWDLWAMSQYSTITSISESPVEEGLLYTGSDDGLVHVSDDGGATWRRAASPPGVSEGFFVNDLKADRHDADTVYLAGDDHKIGDFSPHLFRSTDRGRSWRSIASNLPDRHLVWRVVQDHETPELLFAGTELGLFFTLDGGARWIQLTGGVPTISFRDLAIQTRENDLVGASFGRGFWILDDYSALRHVDEQALEGEALLFPVRTARWYLERRPLGFGEKAAQGDAFFTAPNPPFGAVVTYYLGDGYRTAAAARREAEEERAEAGEDTPYSGWDALEEEAREEEPAIVLTVRDAEGSIVHRLEGSAEAGFHRVAWDLRYPITDAQTAEFDPEFSFGAPAGPGTYTVSLAKRVDGELTDLGLETSFEVVDVTTGTLPENPGAARAFQAELAAIHRVADGIGNLLTGTAERLTGLKAALMRSTTNELDADVRGIEERLADLRLELLGSEIKGDYNEPAEPTILDRLGVAQLGVAFSDYGPTPTHRRTLEIARGKLATLRDELDRLISEDLAALEARAEAAGVPWSPGRGVPRME